MKYFAKLISYIFHPLLVPVAGTMIYFIITPKYSPIELQGANVVPIFILTVVIPIITFFILKNIGLISSVFIPKVKERIFPLVINIILLTLVLIKVIPKNFTAELYYFFLGLIAASVSTLILALLKFKSSLHLMGLGSVYMFLINLSVHFETNITLLLSLFTLTIGIVATCRLYLKAHNKPELIIGLLLGIFSQLITVKFWI